MGHASASIRSFYFWYSGNRSISSNVFHKMRCPFHVRNTALTHQLLLQRHFGMNQISAPRDIHVIISTLHFSIWRIIYLLSAVSLCLSTAATRFWSAYLLIHSYPASMKPLIKWHKHSGIISFPTRKLPSYLIIPNVWVEGVFASYKGI